MKVFTLLLVLVVGIFGYWFWVGVVNTKVLTIEQVGELSLRGVDRDSLFRLLENYQREKIVRIILPDGSERFFSLEDLGVSVDIGDFWYQRNNPRFLVQKFEPKLRASIGKLLIRTGGEASVAAKFSDDGFFVVSGTNRIYELSVGEIVQGIVGDFGKKEIALVPEFRVVKDEYGAYAEINNSLSRVYKDNLVLRVKDGSGQAEIIVPKKVITSSFDVDALKSGELKLFRELVMDYIKKNITQEQRRDFNEEIAFRNITEEIQNRFYSGSGKGVVLGIDDGPTSEGNLASKYLEVDISQQKMYLFVDGALHKEYKVSTGNYYSTPVGQFKILNKAPKAYSDIFGVWMPYWMAFSYAEDIGAYLGLHELPYVAGNSGERIYRFGYYIGRKMTGGCVAMDPKDSKEVYEMSEVGMIVNIVP